MNSKEYIIEIDRSGLTDPGLAMTMFSLIIYGNDNPLYTRLKTPINATKEELCSLTSGLIDEMVSIGARELKDIDWEDSENVKRLLHCFAFVPCSHPVLEELCQSLKFVRRHRDTLKFSGGGNGRSNQPISECYSAVERAIEDAIINELYQTKLIDDYQSKFIWPEGHEVDTLRVLQYDDDLGKRHEFILDKPLGVPDSFTSVFNSKRKPVGWEAALVAYNRLVQVGLIQAASSRTTVATNTACLICDILECLHYRILVKRNMNYRQAKRDFIKDLIF